METERGWVHLWRKMEESEVWEMGSLVVQIFIWMLMRSHGGIKEYVLPGGESIHRGQLATSFPNIREALRSRNGRGFSYPALTTVKFCVSKLKVGRMIDLKADRHGLIVTIINYNKYNPITNESLSERLTESKVKGCPKVSCTQEVLKKYKEVKAASPTTTEADSMGQQPPVSHAGDNGKPKNIKPENLPTPPRREHLPKSQSQSLRQNQKANPALLVPNPPADYVPPEFSAEVWSQIPEAEQKRLFLSGKASLPPLPAIPPLKRQRKPVPLPSEPPIAKPIGTVVNAEMQRQQHDPR